MNTNSQSAKAICRVCGSDKVNAAGTVEYFSEYAWMVFDCDVCGCRFTRHDSTIYNRLHESSGITYYGEYREMAAVAKQFFDRRDLDGLRRFLARSTKSRFIINELESAPADARVLEVGCSRGYLASYFILSGRTVLGIDVSAEAVESARMAFGDHFALADSPLVNHGAPYDIIYHVGMIGCVADPIGLTKQLLAMLKPGGMLLFNAPHRAACWAKNQLWFDTAPPPDVVTLFPHGFWRRQFAEGAEVQEGIELCDADRSFAIALHKQFGRAWHPPQPQAMHAGAELSLTGLRKSDRVWERFERGVCKAARITHLSELAPRWPAEYGLFVKIRRRRTIPATTEGEDRFREK